jgi:hypothetical protein
MTCRDAALQSGRTVPNSARLSASVPPLTNTISRGWQPISRRGLPPRHLQPLLGGLSEMMDAGSVTIHLTETRHRGLQHFRRHRGRRVVIEVETLHFFLF